MDTGAFFIGSLFGMFFGTLFLSLYIYGAVLAGQAIARFANVGRPIWKGVAKIAVVWWPLSLWPLFLDWNPFAKMGVALMFYILNAYPMSIGFGTAMRTRQEEASRRFHKNVDDWLAHWECDPVNHGWDEEM